MNRTLRLVSSILVFVVLTSSAAEAARVRVVHRGRTTRVTVHRGFPIHRTLPRVYVRRPVVAVRVTPRVFLPPVVFGTAVVVEAPAADRQAWSGSETLTKDDEWTEFTLNVDKRGTRLLLQVEDGPAKISFAEVVFDNGDAQVVDFSDKVHGEGLYTLVDFADGRKVDHVRLVAKAVGDETELALRLIT
jgi:hypothetical protein